MNLIKDWNDFWFKERSPKPLALLRIFFGLICAVWAISISPNINDWFTNQGVLPLYILHNRAIEQGPNIDVFNFITSPTLIYCLLSLLIVSSVCLSLGFCTRISAFITWVLLVSFHHRNPYVFSSAETLMRMDALYLLLAPCGKIMSLDRYFEIRANPEKAREPVLVEAWGQRLIQIQLCIVYACSFLAKVPGSYWVTGEALYLPLHMPELLRYPLPLVGSSPVLIWILTEFTMGTEFCLATLIWVPRLRKYLLTAGILLHAGIEYVINVPFFSCTIIATYIVFMPDDWLDAIIRAGRKLLPRLDPPAPPSGPDDDGYPNREARRAAKRRRESEPLTRV